MNCSRKKLCHWFLALLPLVAVTSGLDICDARPKGIPLEPRCIYRSQEPDGPTEEPAPDNTNPRVWELSKANSRFALSIFKEMANSRTPESNIFMSPISISTAFAMTKLGACDQTLEQIMKVFQFDSVKEKTSDQIHFFFAKLNCRLYRKKDVKTVLTSANRLFGEKSLNFNETYQNISETVYGAKLMPLSFKENPDAARVTINDWISNKTQNRIQETLPEGALDSNTVLVLVNTIYFKGQWKNKFNKEDVFTSDFHVNAGKRCSVNMMYQETKFRYMNFQEDKVQLLEMPYLGDDITMVLLLPSRDTTLTEDLHDVAVRKLFGLKVCAPVFSFGDLDFGQDKPKQVEANLDVKTINRWMDGIKETTVSVHIPRFRVEDSFSLKDKLRNMGLKDLFDPDTASLPGMLEDGNIGLYISEAYHKAFLEVNEEGSEAAASTAVVAIGRSFNLDREIFLADRPFLLIIRESTINTLLFVGRVANPCDE